VEKKYKGQKDCRDPRGEDLVMKSYIAYNPEED